VSGAQPFPVADGTEDGVTESEPMDPLARAIRGLRLFAGLAKSAGDLSSGLADGVDVTRSKVYPHWLSLKGAGSQVLSWFKRAPKTDDAEDPATLAAARGEMVGAKDLARAAARAAAEARASRLVTDADEESSDAA